MLDYTEDHLKNVKIDVCKLFRRMRVVSGPQYSGAGLLIGVKR